MELIETSRLDSLEMGRMVGTRKYDTIESDSYLETEPISYRGVDRKGFCLIVKLIKMNIGLSVYSTK